MYKEQIKAYIYTDGRRQAGWGENRLSADRQLYPAPMTERDKLIFY